ncbi:stage II sporulation protein M [Methanobacterium movens]
MIKKEKYESTLHALYRRNEKFFGLSALIFFGSMFMGYFLSGLFSFFLEGLLRDFERNIAQGKIQLNTLSLFTHNLRIILFLYGGGILLGSFTIIFLFINGSFIGYFASKVPLGDLAILTIPHGIFEVLSIVIAGAGGFRLASFVYNYFTELISESWYGSLLGKMTHTFQNNSPELEESLILLGISIVLLFIAAFIEANITLPVAQYVMANI